MITTKVDALSKFLDTDDGTISSPAIAAPSTF